MKTKREIIYLAGFLLSIPIALTAYINSSFLEIYVSTYYVGIIYAVASLLTIWGLLEMPKIFSRYGNRRTALMFSLLGLLSFILLAFGNNIFVIVPAFILFFVASSFIFISLDIFMEDFSKKSSIGGMRGFYLVVINSSWVIAQMISGSVLARNSYMGIYLLSGVFMFLVSVIFILFLHDFVDPKYKKVPIKKTFKYFLQNKNILRIYIINLILKFFFAWMIIYTPIYLREYMGFDWSQIGTIFTIMLLPFVILEFPLGVWSDKIGEKKMLILGFLISALFTSMIPLIAKPDILIWAIILFATRVGAATIEVMSESYLFKSINVENADTVSFFRNTGPVSYIVAPILAIIIFTFVPSFSYMFLILSGVMLVGVLVSMQLQDIK